MRRRCKTLLIVLAVMAMTITVRSGISASRGYDLVHTEQQAEAVEQENERLKIDIARLKSPQRIKDIATKDLGMEVPKRASEHFRAAASEDAGALIYCKDGRTMSTKWTFVR